VIQYRIRHDGWRRRVGRPKWRRRHKVRDWSCTCSCRQNWPTPSWWLRQHRRWLVNCSLVSRRHKHPTNRWQNRWCNWGQMVSRIQNLNHVWKCIRGRWDKRIQLRWHWWSIMTIWLQEILDRRLPLLRTSNFGIKWGFHKLHNNY